VVVFVALAALLQVTPTLAASTAPSLSQSLKRINGAVVVVRASERVAAALGWMPREPLP